MSEDEDQALRRRSLRGAAIFVGVVACVTAAGAVFGDPGVGIWGVGGPLGALASRVYLWGEAELDGAQRRAARIAVLTGVPSGDDEADAVVRKRLSEAARNWRRNRLIVACLTAGLLLAPVVAACTLRSWWWLAAGLPLALCLPTIIGRLRVDRQDRLDRFDGALAVRRAAGPPVSVRTGVPRTRFDAEPRRSSPAETERDLERRAAALAAHRQQMAAELARLHPRQESAPERPEAIRD